MDAAKQYVENCKREGKHEGKRTERERMNDALYGKQGCKIYIGTNRSIIDEMRDNLPQARHDEQDAVALALPPTTGILGAVATSLHPEQKGIVHVDIPREPDVFKPTKSMLDILSERIDIDLTKCLTEFGKKNGFPVVFVFYQTLKNENGVSKATCDIKMYKSDEKQDARLFALKHAGEFGIFDPRSKDEQINDLEKKVKRLEEDRDYWKRKAEGDDGDTLGIFKHWDD